MSRTYADFLDELKTYVWRPNDAELAVRVHSLIKMANSELDRRLDITRRIVVLQATKTGDDTNIIAVPSDCKRPVSFNSNNYFYGAPTLGKITHELAINATNRERPFLAYANGNLYFPFLFKSTGDNFEYTLEYIINVPDFQSTDASWVEDEYLDLYMFTCAKHVAVWLKDSNGIQEFSALADKALNGIIEDDKFNQAYGSSPLALQMPRSPSPNRGRRGRPGSLYS